MTIDLAQFIQTFLEEADEHIATLESGLLDFDPEDGDPERMNEIFRAAHSIKGGAATFGLGRLAEFTHTLETLLDRVRHHELVLDEMRRDACLRAVDVLRELLEGCRSGQDGDVAEAAALSQELTTLADPDRKAGPAEALAGAPALGGNRWIRIVLDLPEAAAVRADAWSNLVATLSQLGLTRADSEPDDVRAAGRHWIEVETDAHLDELRVFVDFAFDPAWVAIEEVASDERKQADAGQAYGFFDPTAGSGGRDGGNDEAWGLFEPELGEAKPPLEEAYGLFDAMPSSPMQSTPPAAGVSTTDDPGYGFFEADAAPVTAQCEPETAYGLFDASPRIEMAPAQAVELALPAKKDPVVETQRRPVAAAGADTTSIRVGIHKVDQLINLVGELVITQSMLLESASVLDPVVYEKLLGGLAQLERNSRDLQESVMSIRMVPMSLVFSRYPRLLRDLARKLGKQAELHLVGESTELDKGMVEKIIDPLTHLVRNAVDHGLEMPDERIAAGKSPAGHITLSAAHQSGHILIEISDDGAGLRRDRILAKAAKQGIATSAEMSDSEVWNLIFAPGFSTAEEVTDVSGRGVGMDVVRRNIQSLGGSVEVSSTAGFGTRVSIRLPLTLAILDGMSVRAGTETFIVPLGFVIESLQGETLEFSTVGRHGKVVRVRDRYLPVASLGELLDIPGSGLPVEESVLIVLESNGRRLALGVDALLGQHQVVVKNLETNYRRVKGISGATILGDGRVSLILDVGDLIKLTQHAGNVAAA